VHQYRDGRVSVLDVTQCLQGKPGLAAAARADDKHNPRSRLRRIERSVKRREHVVAADERSAVVQHGSCVESGREVFVEAEERVYTCDGKERLAHRRVPELLEQGTSPVQRQIVDELSQVALVE
jgi:hypothetical protein